MVSFRSQIIFLDLIQRILQKKNRPEYDNKLPRKVLEALKATTSVFQVAIRKKCRSLVASSSLQAQLTLVYSFKMEFYGILLQFFCSMTFPLSLAYDNIILVEARLARSDLITSKVGIIIAPPNVERWDNMHYPFLCVMINNGNAIGAKSVCQMGLMAIVTELLLAAILRKEKVEDALRCCQIAKSKRKRP